MQLPAQLAGMGDADGAERAHTQLDIAHRLPREALVAQHRVGVAHQLLEDGVAVRPGDGENAPSRGDVLHDHLAECALYLLGQFARVIAIVIRPGTGRDQGVIVPGLPHDSVFDPRRAGFGQRMGQVAADLGQLVGGEPVEEGRRPLAMDAMLGKGRGVDQPGGTPDRLGLGLGILPPATAAEAARCMVVETGGGVGGSRTARPRG